jgi:pimeloyl-ACP methyl ester carboxylesterase
MKTYLFIVLALCFGSSFAQQEYLSEEINITPLVTGTLLLPDTEANPPLVVIIGDSGPMDRDGNQQMMKNNAMRFLAEGLYQKGIASFRYDKRLIKIMKRGRVDERAIEFDHFIEDAIAVTTYFKDDSRFSKLYVLGHGQGSLVGMIAANGLADGYISVAGAGQELDDMIVDQIANQSPGLTDNARQSFDDLRANGVAMNYSEGLASIFRPDIQPFLFSWMQYDPQEEIVKLQIPVYIIMGDKDLQVRVSEGELLHNAKPEARYEVIKNMNHIFKEIKGNDIENSKSYNEYNRPVMPELVNMISDFIKE